MWEDIENLIESETIPADILQSNPHIQTFSRVFAGAKRVPVTVPAASTPPPVPETNVADSVVEVEAAPPSLPSAESESSLAASAPGLVLKYWDGRGLMEVPRMMLAIAGRFPGSGYEDGRYSAPPPAGLEANLGRMPVLETATGGSIGQSAAINFYLASELGLMGSTAFEAAQIIGISEHLSEMAAAYRALVPYGTEPSEEQTRSWFEGGAMDVEGPADASQRSTRYLRWWMGRVEAVLGGGGFAVGNTLTLADVLLYNAFSEHLSASHTAEDTPEWRRHPFGSGERMEQARAAHPKIRAICDSVAANENVQQWLSTRGLQRF